MNTQYQNISLSNLSRLGLVTVFGLVACGEPDHLILQNETAQNQSPASIQASESAELAPIEQLSPVDSFSVRPGSTRVHANCIVVEPGQVNFGSVASGAYHGRTIEIKNICPVDVRVIEAGISADSSNRFVVDSPQSSFIIPAGKSTGLEIGLTAYLGREAFLGNSRPGAPIILRNNHEGQLDIVFSDVDQSLVPTEVWMAAIELRGQVDTQTSAPRIQPTLDPRLHLPLKRPATPEPIPLDDPIVNPLASDRGAAFKQGIPSFREF